MEPLMTTLQRMLAPLLAQGSTMIVYDANGQQVLSEFVIDSGFLLREDPENEAIVMHFRPVGLWPAEAGWDWERTRHFEVSTISQTEELRGVPAAEREGYPAALPPAPPGGLRLMGDRYQAIIRPGTGDLDWADWVRQRDEVLSRPESRAAWEEQLLN